MDVCQSSVNCRQGKTWMYISRLLIEDKVRHGCISVVCLLKTRLDMDVYQSSVN
jgi:hypothetical protein